jgi:hypothetical protein
VSGAASPSIAGGSCGLTPLRHAGSVSLMVHRHAIERFGLPLEHSLIWYDDIDCTAPTRETKQAGPWQGRVGS